jgi:hypothetical protein
VVTKEAEERPTEFITSFRCNVPDLYGVVRGDDALISRLVIIEMLECAGKLELQRFAQKCDPSTAVFKYSLDQWLLNVFVAPDEYTPCRYYSTEKYEFIKYAKQTKSNSVERCLGYVLTEQQDMFECQSFKEIQYRTIQQSTVNRSYKVHMSGRTQIYGDQNTIQALIDQGFEQCKIQGTNTKNHSGTI